MQTFQHLGDFCSNLGNRNRRGLLVAYHHLSLDTILVQGFHQSVGGNGTSSRQVAGTNQEDFHL